MNTVFEDPSTTVVGKMFLAGIASAVLGLQPHIKVRGTPEQIEAIKCAVEAAHDFNAILEKPGVTVQEIMDKLEAKNMAAQSFEEQLGLPWPL